ncbi:hypothetical protein PGB90_002517 [Kerria lacca]
MTARRLGSNFTVCVERVVQCPGCYKFCSNKVNAIKHLLGICISLKNKNACRELFIQWILNFFSRLDNESTISVEYFERYGCKRKKIFNQYVLMLNMSSCPICQSYFPEESIWDHLYESDLFVEKSIILNSIFSLRLSEVSNIRINTQNINLQETNEDSEALISSRISSNINSFGMICILCNYETFSEEMFQEHVIKDHLRCHNCKKNVNSFNNLMAHAERKHPENNIKGIYCPLCSIEIFNSVETFNNHILKCQTNRRSIAEIDVNIDDIYPCCFLCNPIHRVLITEFSTHLQKYHL